MAVDGPPLTPLLVNDHDAAKLLSISRASLHRLRASGQFIEPIRLGHKLLFDRDELIDWKNARCPDLIKWRSIQAQSRRSSTRR